MDETYFDNESLLKDQLINKILIVTAVITLVVLCVAEYRTMSLGMAWSYRDLLQIIVVGFIVLLACFRNRLPGQFKSISFIVLLSLGGFSGVNSLGMLGGTVWIFPTALVLMAVFYSKLVTRLYIGFTIILFILVATRFCAEKAILPYDADELLSSSYHWFVYILCLMISFIVTCVTIQNYREKMNLLIEKIGIQSDELAKKNKSLSKALEDVETLSGMLPICSSCKNVRDDKGYWNQIELYLEKHSKTQFSHGLCPECADKLYGDKEWYIEMKKKKGIR